MKTDQLTEDDIRSLPVKYRPTPRVLALLVPLPRSDLMTLPEEEGRELDDALEADDAPKGVVGGATSSSRRSRWG